MEEILDESHIQPEHSYVRYGGFWQRFGALFIDGLVLTPITFGVSYFNITTWKSSLLLAILTIIGIGYKPFMEANYGATLGKMALKLKVTNLGHGTATLSEILVRNVFHIVPQIIALLLTFAVYNDPRFESITGFREFTTFSQQFTSLQYVNYANILIIIVDAIVLASDSKKMSLHDKIAGTLVIETP